MRTTLNLDDDLIIQAKILAVHKKTSLSRLIEDALRLMLEGDEEIDLPSADGGGFPDGFPFHSGTLMIDFVERLDANARR